LQDIGLPILKPVLNTKFKEVSKQKGLTQDHVAKILTSRKAKMQGAENSVSIDLLISSLLVLCAT
jgi:hypothetical protein